MKSHTGSPLWVVGLICAACAMSGLSSAAGPVDVDVGNGLAVAVDPGKPLNIAYFAPSGNSFLQANLEALDEAAKGIEGTYQFYDANWDAGTQLNQIQNAIQSGRFNAFIVQPLDGHLLCHALTEDAPKAGILVAIAVVQLCDRATLPDEQQWAPGTATFVGGAFSVTTVHDWMVEVARRSPGKHKVGVLTGALLVADTINFDKALADAKATNPDWEIVGVQRTDVSVPDALAKAQNLIQAHPDIDTILTTYSNISRGAVTALQLAGRKPGEVKVYDMGGTAWSKQAILDGWVEFTMPRYARSVIHASVRSLAEASSGKPGPHYIPNDGAPPSAALILDRSNIDAFVPESD
ncbi:sugar ABC transporter substrate-binding protein [Inquilinus limosus]|nr:sugar ABC transporter substrate-binding protein [Inquilinus limosus]